MYYPLFYIEQRILILGVKRRFNKIKSERKEHADEIIEKLAEQTSKRAVSGTQKMQFV